MKPSVNELLSQRRFIQLKDGMAIETPVSLDFIEDYKDTKVVFKYPNEILENTIEEYRELHKDKKTMTEVLNEKA